MDVRGIQLIEATQTQLRLPADLRTEHWYNDWQHAVFIITFDHLMRAIRAGRGEVTERLTDKLTVYLFVHFLCEEEGMAWACSNKALRPDLMRQHQDGHIHMLGHWHDAIQKPYKAGRLEGRALAAKIQDFYDRILDHIGTADQTTYGTKTDRAEAIQLEEVAHLSNSGLPLSPNMAGAAAIVAACNAEAFRLLNIAGLPVHAAEPLRPLSLARLQGEADNDSLRARLLRAGGVQPQGGFERLAA